MALITMRKVLEEMAGKVEALLGSGQLPPWNRPWKPVANGRPGLGQHWNPITQRAYRGFNVSLLQLEASLRGFEDPRWMGYQQAAKKGWQVGKGEQATTIYYPVPVRLRREDADKADEAPVSEPDGAREKDRKTGVILLMKGFKVFNAQQMDGVPSLVRDDESQDAPVKIPQAELIDAIAKTMGVPIREGGDRAAYIPSVDRIIMPPAAAFPDPADREQTRLHELTHATGHGTRLNRDLSGPFGSAKYAQEEVTAEFGSWLLAQRLNIPYLAGNPEMTEEQTATYIAGWTRALKGDEGRKMYAQAIGNAMKVSRYMENILEMAVSQGLIAQDVATALEIGKRHEQDEPSAPDGRPEEEPTLSMAMSP
jgi:antirestriction protein ArdC